MQSFISIISPVYNTPADCFDRFVSSVLGQTLRNFELILVDDGSASDCAERCDGAAKRDTRVRVIHQQNAGFAGAMNAGINAARGEYIMFVDPDDEIPPFALEHALQISEENKSDMVCSSLTLRYPSKDIVGSFDLEPSEVKVLNCDELEAYRVFCLTSLLPKNAPQWFSNGLGRGHVAKLIKKELFNDVRLVPTMCAGSDSLMVAELLSRARCVTLVNESWYYYYMNSFSVTHNYSYEKDEREFRSMDSCREKYGADFNAACFARYCDTASCVSAAGFSAWRGLSKHLTSSRALRVFKGFDQEKERYELSRARSVASWLGARKLGAAIALLYCMRAKLHAERGDAF